MNSDGLSQIKHAKSLDEVYLDIAQNPTLWEFKPEDFLRRLCEDIAEALQVERVAVYDVDKDKNSVIQKNLYLLSKQKHYSGLVLDRSDYAKFFDSLEKSRIIEVSDAKHDARAKEFFEDFIVPRNIGAVLDCTLYHAGKLSGVVCAEHVGDKRHWREDEKRFLTSVSDLLSQRLKILTVLEEKEERYRHVFEHSGDGIFLIRDNRVVDCNQAGLDLFGCTREQILNKPVSDFSPELQPDGTNSHELAHKKTKAAIAGEVQVFEYLHIRIDGTSFPSEVTLSRIEMDGQPFTLTSVRDISARKETESDILEQNRGLSLINELSNQLQGAYSVDDIFEKTVLALEDVIPLSYISIFTVDCEKQELHYKTGLRHRPEVLKQFSVIPLNKIFHQRSLTSGNTINIPEIKADQDLLPEIRDALLHHGFNSMIEVPFIVQGSRTAVLFLHYESVNGVSPYDQEVLLSISKTVSLALDNAKTRSELAYMAHHDSLTGLGNRAYYHKQFQDHINDEGYDKAALYLLDLDRFKEINDTLGHFTGDKILQQIGPRLNKLIHEHKFMVCRLGGDEFIVLVYGVNNDKDASKIADKILASLRAPFQIDDLTLGIDASVGVVLYPTDGKDSHDLLRSADVAMYQAKQTGKGFALYEEHNDIHTPKRLAMIAELGNSISSGQLFLHYQPKINLQTNEVLGFEALARWDHPRLGLLSPDRFVPLIEMSNSIFQLTEEVLHQALSQQMQWRKNGLNYSVAVNISARNLIDDRIITLLENMLNFYDTPPSSLELEVTETALMHDAYRATSYLQRISKLGVQLSIDDFGTGYSSLAYLYKLPINKLKLDRAFVMAMLDSKQGESIVKTIISLSKTLELEVVAEGVEDQNTLDKLKELDCDQAQGYHICRPNDWASIEHWLKDSKAI